MTVSDSSSAADSSSVVVDPAAELAAVADPAAAVDPAVAAEPAAIAAVPVYSLAPATAAPAAPRVRSADDELDDDRIAAALDERGGNMRRLALFIGLGLLVLFLAVTALIGRSNGQRYVLLCGADQVTAEQGRTFPPWGERRLSGAQWKPVAIPPAAECREREAGSESELAGWYLGLLVEQATARLTARQVVDVDLAAAQLDQALLLARAPERRDQRRDIDRLLGDVEYWRAVAKLRTASDALGEAAKQFEEAALKQPKHVTDAPARAEQLRRLILELGGSIAPPPGPGAAQPPGTGTGIAPTILPEAPTGGPVTSSTPSTSSSPSTPSSPPLPDATGSDAAPAAPLPDGGPAQAETPAVDAAVPPPSPPSPPSGGVLL